MIYDVDDTGRVWSDLRRKEDDLKWGGHTPGFGRHSDSMGRPASTSSNFGFAWGNEQMGRVSRVRRALDESGPMSQRMIAQSLSHIDLSTIWHILISACQDIALYYGGSVLAGGFIGGAGGVLFAGVGAVPGAALGAAAGGQVGGFVLSVLGLHSFVEGVAHAIPEALNCYAKGFVEAWGPTRQDRHQSFGGGARGDPSSGAFHLAQGHVILIGIILAVLAGYVMSGRADLLNKIGLSPRLGPKVARWVEENKEKLRQYLASRTRGRGAVANEQLPPPKARREPVKEQERDTSGNSGRVSRNTPEVKNEHGENNMLHPLENDSGPASQVDGEANSGPGGTVFSGHGSYFPVNGTTVVPEGTSITFYSEHGGTITNGLGNAIETGKNVSDIFQRSFGPGSEIPNYTLHPPGNLKLQGSPFTVSTDATLDSLLQPGMGNVCWAACTFNPYEAAGNLRFGLEGVLDKSTKQYIKLYGQ